MELKSKHDKQVTPECRLIRLDRGRAEQGNVYLNNYISTGKYNWYNFLPKNLFEQFHRVANIWFLTVSVLQLLPLNLSPTSSWATVAPLALVLTVTLIKDLILDIRRHRSDEFINNRLCSSWDENSTSFIDLKWMKLSVGNIVVLKNDEPIPADLVILSTSHDENICYIETSNLDGESNLKIKSALPETAAIFNSKSYLEAIKKISKLDESTLKSEHPNNRLYTYDGSLKLKGHPKGTPIDNNNILLRGCTLKNTKWMLGVIVFTGNETKLMINSKTPPHKRSNVERRVNRYLIIVFTMLFFTAFISAIISIAYSYTHTEAAEFFSGQSYTMSGFNFITFLILYNSLVPISLYVTMDLVRVFQAKFMQWDLRMYYEPIDRPAIAKTGDLNEDLGQIEYVFSDKTGTLTENQMVFRRCFIQGKVYGSLNDTGCTERSCVYTLPEFKFNDECLLEDLRGTRGREISEFLELLSLCHTVILEQNDGKLRYEAASPDEEALVIAAHCFGYSFQNTRPGFCSLNINGGKVDYRVIGINEFNSDRKRMSIVVQQQGGNRPAMLYCKGADNVMLERVNASRESLNVLNKHLSEFSVQGLRTLVLAKRELTEEQVTEYEKQWTYAKNAMIDRAKRLEEVADDIERDMEILGATAIEDKIQPGVPETIANLMKGGIKVWVLTGDKQETAVNIGYSCKLLQQNMDIITINVKGIEEARNKLKQALSTYVYKSESAKEDNFVRHVRYMSSNSVSRRTPIEPQNASFDVGRSLKFVKNMLGEEEMNQPINVEGLNLALVVDGASLEHILNDASNMKLFSMLSCLCHSVICCRVSPLQKAEVVKLVKNHFAFRPMTLAIGDGANDVSMIQEAHVGIGICGKEGLQAVNSSDYAIARFSYLQPLLFLHGRWNYQRITKVILYSFYKNFLLVLPMFYFSFTNQFSGSALYDSWLIMAYNVGFTALPVIILGCLDKDIDPDIILHNPALYTEGIFSRRFNAKVFLKWTLMAICHSLIIYFFISRGSQDLMDTEGSSEDMIMIGTIAYICVVQTASYVIILEMKDWNTVFCIVVTVSVLAFYPLVLVYDYGEIPTPNLRGAASRLFSVVPYFLLMTFVPLICFLVNYAEICIRSLWYPSEADLLIKQLNHTRIQPYVYDDSLFIDKPQVPIRSAQYASKLPRVFNSKGIKKPQDPSQDEERDDFSLQLFTLNFVDTYLEKNYQLYKVQKTIKFMRYIAILIFIGNLVWTISDVVANYDNIGVVVLRIGVTIILAMIVIYSRTKFFLSQYEISIIFIILAGLIAKFGLEVMSQNDGSMSQGIVPILTFVLFNVSTYKVLIINLIFNVFYIIRVSITYSHTLNEITLSIIILNYTALLLGITLVSGFVGYALEKSKRTEFVLIKQLENQYQKGQDILGTLLPKFVKNRVAQGVRYIAKDQGTVTVMFCDIYDFDRICVSHTPNELIELLDKFFAELDALCDKHGVTKIETVNKTYMICGGLKDSETNLSPELLAKNHAERTVLAGFDILKKLENVYLKTGEKFRVKIGINSGPVIAGVVGDHKPQFSLVGDTVNTASRMCAAVKKPDMIRISSGTFEFVKHMNLSYTSESIEAKGKGTLETYIITPLHSRNNSRFSLDYNPENNLDVTLEDLSVSRFPLIHPNDKNEQNEQVDDREDKEELHINELSSLISDKNTELDEFADIKSIEDDDTIRLAGPVQWLICSLKETKSQHDYRINQIQCDLRGLKFGLIMTIGIYSTLTIIFIIGYNFLSSHGSVFFILFRLYFILLMVLLVLYLKRTYKNMLFPWAVMMMYMITSFIIILQIFVLMDTFIYAIVLEIMYTNVVVSHISALPFGHILMATLFMFAHWMCVAFSEPHHIGLTIEATFFLFCFMMLNLIASYMREHKDRKTYNLNKLAKRQIENTEKLLNQMMPPQVVRNLKNDIATTDRYPKMTILFADICGFTSWSSDKNPIEVVSMLSNLFSAFDHLCVKNNVYKVHTIGDCYVVLGFTDPGEVSQKRSPGQECINVVNMALDMIKGIRKVNQEKRISLNMRIGLHTGEVTAGITGTNIVRYDIYGPDVDIANKMESNGQAGKINVSEVTKKLLEKYNPDRFEYHFNKVVSHEPMNRSLDSFLLIGLRHEDLECE